MSHTPTPEPSRPMPARPARHLSSAAPASFPKPSRVDASPLLSPAADPDAVLREILTHLGELRYRTAQRLAKEAAVRYPDHPGLRRMNRGLNEWTVTTSPGNEPSSREEFEWLRNPPESARGKVVALVGGELVAAADTMAELMQSLKAMKLAKSPLVHRID